MKNTILSVTLSVLILILSGCSAENAVSDETSSVPDSTQRTVTLEENMYTLISPDEAKKIIDETPECIILDVRTDEEYNQKRIPNSVLIPDYELEKRVQKELPDKDALILVYCRTGRRSKAAAKELIKMGYTNIMDFGGIEMWPYQTE